MRRESSTVVAVVGDVDEALLAGLSGFPNLSIARAAAVSKPDGAAAELPAWEKGAIAMREAARRRSTYVMVAEDPLSDIAAAWRAMWDLSAGDTGPADFEMRVADTLSAWHAKRFELPDYYLVIASAQPGTLSHSAAAAELGNPDLYLGPLRAARPRRVAVAAYADDSARAIRALDELRSLQHGPWWPSLDELLDSARRFYPGELAEAQHQRDGRLLDE